MVRRGIVAGFRGNGIIRSGRGYDQTIAHLTNKDISTTFNDLDECLNYLKELWEKYYNLLCGQPPALIFVE